MTNLSIEIHQNITGYVQYNDFKPILHSGVCGSLYGCLILAVAQIFPVPSFLLCFIMLSCLVYARTEVTVELDCLKEL